MKHRYIYTSLTRISDLETREFQLQELSRSDWETGDYVVCKITDAGSTDLKLELPNGRMRGAIGGKIVVGALGERYATLEATGTWKEVGEDGMMHVLTAGGMMGKLTSKSVFVPNIMEVQYLGHAFRDNRKLTMEQFVKPVAPMAFNTPVILFVGTSMSAGKTTSARIVTHLFKSAGLKVVGAKLSGAGRYRDILAIKDAGADAVLDFVDAGIPSSICSVEKYREKVQYLMHAMARQEADVAVIEIGASPLEPYNGSIAIEAIIEHVKCVILSASDPYAVYGLMKAFEITPDIVTGIATNTLAGSEMVEKLCYVRALNLIDPKTTPVLKDILSKATGFSI